MTGRLRRRRPYLSAAEAARELGISTRRAQELCAEGVLETRERPGPGSSWKVKPGSVDRLKAERR
jgi:hypothetical protein